MVWEKNNVINSKARTVYSSEEKSHYNYFVGEKKNYNESRLELRQLLRRHEVP